MKKYNKPPLTLQNQLNPITKNNILQEVITLTQNYNIPLEEMGLNKSTLKALNEK